MSGETSVPSNSEKREIRLRTVRRVPKGRPLLVFLVGVLLGGLMFPVANATAQAVNSVVIQDRSDSNRKARVTPTGDLGISPGLPASPVSCMAEVPQEGRGTGLLVGREGCPHTSSNQILTPSQRLAISSLTLINYNDMQVTFRLVANELRSSSTGCEDQANSTRLQDLMVLVPARETLHLSFPQPLVIPSNTLMPSRAWCLDALVPSGGLDIITVGFGV